jgi:hypothetical protein
MTIATGNPAPNAILQGEYYIQLPQSSIDLVNGSHVNNKLTMLLGAADLRALSPMEVKHDILDITHQDSPFNQLVPNFNLSSCYTDSSAIYGELKLLVVRIALDTIHQILFMVLVPSYSIEPHNVLDHIWQCYVNTEGKTVQLSTQVYYSIFLNAICLFCNLEEYPINLAGIFQDHIDPSMQKGFHSHYPQYGQSHTKVAITQWLILVDMLNTRIKAKNNLTNI